MPLQCGQGGGAWVQWSPGGCRTLTLFHSRVALGMEQRVLPSGSLCGCFCKT